MNDGAEKFAICTELLCSVPESLRMHLNCRKHQIGISTVLPIGMLQNQIIQKTYLFPTYALYVCFGYRDQTSSFFAHDIALHRRVLASIV